MELRDSDKLEVEWYAGWFTARIPRLCDINLNIDFNEDSGLFEFSVPHSGVHYVDTLERYYIETWIGVECDLLYFDGIHYFDIADLSKAMLAHEMDEVKAA